jgi:cytochrome c
VPQEAAGKTRPYFPKMSLLLRRILFLLACLGPLAAWSQGSACGDAFAGPALDPAWSFLDADGEPGGSVRVEGGKLELAGKGSDAFQDVNEFVGVRRAGFTGDFDVSVKIESQSNTNGWAQAGILAANDAGQPSKGGYVIVDVTPSNGYHAFYDASGTQGTLDTHADVGTSTYPVWVRLARTGTRYSAWYKNQASAAWQPIAANFQAQGTGASSQIALVSLSHNDGAEAKTVFDDFTCQGTATALSAIPKAADAVPARPGSLSVFSAGDGHVDAAGRARPPLNPKAEKR